MSASHPLLKFKLGQYPPSVVSLIHSAAAHRSGRKARVQNAVADADRHAAAFGCKALVPASRRRPKQTVGACSATCQRSPASSETPGVEIRTKRDHGVVVSQIGARRNPYSFTNV